MKLVFSDQAWDDYQWWQSPENAAGLAKLHSLIKDARRNPFTGLGNPESLRGDLSGWWSRRITGEHRFVYRVAGKGADQCLEIAQLRYQY